MPLFGPPNIEKLKQKRDVKGLLKALSHKDPIIRLNAERALDELGTAAVGPLVSTVLHAWTAGLRQAAMEALRKLGPAGVEPIIIEASQDEHPIEAMELLSEMGTQAIETLIAHLEDEDEGTRWWVATALGELEGAQAVEPLTAALQDDDENVREAAEDALERIGGPEAERALAEYHAQRQA